MSPDKSLPDTVNDCAADGVPTGVLNAVVEPESVIEGVAACILYRRMGFCPVE
jgi:uncharacterized membrane protein